jgi:hypothetical protein
MDIKVTLTVCDLMMIMDNNNNNNNNKYDDDMFAVRNTFSAVVKSILNNVNLSHAVDGNSIEKIYSVELNNFEAFSAYYKQSADHTTNTLSRLIIGQTIRNLLIDRWPDENFQFDTAEITVNEFSGAFNSVFESDGYVVRIHAYVGVEKGGKYPSRYKVDVYAVKKTQVQSVVMMSRWWCCF